MSSNFQVKDKYRLEKKFLLMNNYTQKDIIQNQLEGRDLYDYPAAKQEIIQPNALRISSEKIRKIIDSLFECPICRDVFKDPHQRKKCLHTFCKSCFDKLLTHTNNNNCPLCRDSITTRREAVKNETIQEILKILVPDRDEYIESKEADELKMKIKEEENYEEEGKSSDNDNVILDNALKMFKNQSIPENIVLNDLGIKKEYEDKENDDTFLKKKMKMDILMDEPLRRDEQRIKRQKLQISKTKCPFDLMLNEYKKRNLVFLKLLNLNEKNSEINLLVDIKMTITEVEIYIVDKYNYEYDISEIELYIKNENV